MIILGQKLDGLAEPLNGVIAISNEPLAIFTISVSGYEPIYLPVANIYGIQEYFNIN